MVYQKCKRHYKMWV